MTVVVGAPQDFTLEASRRVAVAGEDVVIGADAVPVMGAARAEFERLLRADPGGFIYGVTARPGVEVGTAIPPENRGPRFGHREPGVPARQPGSSLRACPIDRRLPQRRGRPRHQTG